MRAFPSVTAFLLLAASGALGAQRPDQPTLVLTIFGGATTGNDLWTVAQQPLCVLEGTGCSANDDTLRLVRKVNSSLVLGLSAEYYPRAAVGLYGEIVYLGLGLDDTCSAPAFRDQRNADLCANVSAAAGTGSGIAFLAGATVRPPRAASVTPYVRLGGGVLGYGTSTVEVAGTYVESGLGPRTREVIRGPKGGSATPVVLAAMGLTAGSGSGYRLRVEARDVYTGFRTVTAPANRQGLGATSETRFFHFVGLIIGLDIVLEQKRGRRY